MQPGSISLTNQRESFCSR